MELVNVVGQIVHDLDGFDPNAGSIPLAGFNLNDQDVQDAPAGWRGHHGPWTRMIRL